MPGIRLLTVPVLLLLSCALALRAQQDSGLPAENINTLQGFPELSPWVHSVTVRGSLGWRDNLLLSPFSPISAGFMRGELESFVVRGSASSSQFLAFLNGDVLRYFSPPPETGGEQQWFLHTEGRWSPLSFLHGSLSTDVFYQNLVVDLSDTEASRFVAPIRAEGAFATLKTGLQIPGGFTLEPQLQVKRTNYLDFPGDYTESIPGIRLAWKQGAHLTLSAAVFETRRRYLERENFTAGGRALSGTHLVIRQREFESKASLAWTLAGAWTSSVTFSQVENRDGASGFFDTNQKRGRLELAWKRGNWNISFDGSAKRIDYLVQTVGAGLVPPPRIADDFEAKLRVERQLNETWTVFVEHSWERSRSNESEFSYRANTMLAGVQREF